jgi:hypothetical protein
MLIFFDTCRDTIRTLPLVQHDAARVEDLDTKSEDHAVDETRYACASRPWTKPVPKTDVPLRGIESMSINQLWAKQPKTGGRI